MYIVGYTPIGRYRHSTVLVYDTLYMWGGGCKGLPYGVHDGADKMRYISHVDTFTMTTGIWSMRPTTGVPPLGVGGYSCTTINNNICFFGGECNHDPIDGICNGYHNSINMLDTHTLQWNELSPTADDNNVMRRAYGGILHVSFNEDMAFIIGGCGHQPTTQQPNSTYILGYCYTNECNVFNITSSKYNVYMYYTSNNYNIILFIGKWSVPIISGQRPPPCAYFTLNKLPHNRGIMFGGDGGGTTYNDVYIIELTSDTVVRY